MVETAPAWIIETFPVGPLQCNCTLIGDPARGEALVVDPGGDAQKILDRLAAHHLKITGILHTHAHFDHFLASGTLKARTGASLALHKQDQFLWDMLETQCGMFGIPYEPAPPPDHWLEHEEPVTAGTCCGTALHTPGHTPGSMCFSFPEAGLLIAGDTLFRGSVGRTDLWGGDPQAIAQSIRTHLYALDEATRVITGHGPATRIGDEMRHNPFVPALSP
jgi:glyoxylase-like metal-dependent hydrolase (beta-lactamase superfamily II)